MDMVVAGAQAVAKDVATGAVGSLIFWLGKLLMDEHRLQASTREKIKSLIEELECAQIALRKVDRVPPDQLDEHVRIWARKVKEASYDMEDEIDKFLVHVHGGGEENAARQEGFFQSLVDTVCRLIIGMPSKWRKIDGAIDNIYKRLEDVTQQYGPYTVVDNITVAKPPASLDPRLAAMYKEVSELVGIKKSRAEVIAMLSPLGSDNETEKKMKKVSIVGVGGLGKTTLAKSVYDKLKVDFTCSAFVTVGRNPDLKKVFRDILIEIDKDNYFDKKIKMLDEKKLIDEVRENLGNKRYLLVIDDIWETKSWETINLALVENNSGSRIITTTRISEVARKAGDDYKLKHLPRGKSKKLFYRRIFRGEGKCPDNQLDEISNKILKKCDGVPLAIITMASLLVDKSRGEWIKVCNSIAFCDKENKQVSDMEWILSLSYYDLPPHLRTCLLYLCVFPEDHIIDKESLIWMWIAEGFVHNKPGTHTLFEVGTGYFNELVNRNMIQVVELKNVLKIVQGLVGGCRVHDMVLDLLRLKLQEENFAITVSGNNVEATSSQSRVRRLTHQYQNVEHSKMDIGHVRSFIASWCQIDTGFSFRSFTLLRVLALEHCNVGVGGPIDLKHLCQNLFHLRYLGLGHSWINEIPEEIGALKFLQTLDLEGAFFENETLPSSIGRLTQLICLRARSMWAPNGVIEKLSCLEQLEIDASNDMIGQLFIKELDKLKVLNVLMVLRVHDCTPLLDKAMCETVALPRPLQRLMVPHIDFSELPSCISPSDLPNLTHLTLRVHCMDDQHLDILGQLPELCHLNLGIKSHTNAAKVVVTNGTGCFQKLRSLTLPDSTVIFVLNEDSSILFMLNRGSNVPTIGMDLLGCRKRDVLLLPNLQVLEFAVYMERSDVINYGTFACLPSLRRVEVNVQCYNMPLFDDDDLLERWEAALMQEIIEGHPNRPTVQVWFD